MSQVQLAPDSQVSPSRGSSERQRLQLEFTPEAFERLQEIRVKAGARSNAEVVRNAIRIYEWMLERLDEGYSLQTVKEGVVRDIELVL